MLHALSQPFPTRNTSAKLPNNVQEGKQHSVHAGLQLQACQQKNSDTNIRDNSAKFALQYLVRGDKALQRLRAQLHCVCCCAQSLGH